VNTLKTEMQKKKLWQQNVMNFGKEFSGTGIQKEVKKYLLALVTGISMGNEFSVEGYNECLITYILAASSPTYSIDAETYYKGWTRNGTYLTDKTKYGLPLYVKHNYAEEYGGPFSGRNIHISGLILQGYPINW
jgi:hypothetical protein